MRDCDLRLGNSTQKAADAQILNVGLKEFFDSVLSADTVRRLKPAPEPYQMAAKSFGVKVYDIRLVAAHAWDVAGALHAGFEAAFVACPGMVLDPLAPKPDVIDKDLREVADRIIQSDVGR